jgi:hypothetical protein
MGGEEIAVGFRWLKLPSDMLDAVFGVFGLRLAIAGLAVFVLGAVVVCVAIPTEGSEP